MQQERQPVKVFPTHDPDDNPLPPSPGDLPSAIFSTVAGVIFVVVGIVFYFKNAPKTAAPTSAGSAVDNNSTDDPVCERWGLGEPVRVTLTHSLAFEYENVVERRRG
jgi:hypothetical protein